MGFSQATCSVSLWSLSAPQQKFLPQLKEWHEPSHDKYLVKHQPRSLYAPATKIICMFSAARAHSTDLCPALGCVPLTRALTSLEVTLATPGGTGAGQCANCVGNLREPYAVCEIALSGGSGIAQLFGFRWKSPHAKHARRRLAQQAECIASSVQRRARSQAAICCLLMAQIMMAAWFPFALIR